MLDEFSRKAREAPVPWNDVLEQRVLAKVLARGESPSAARFGPWRWAVAVTALTAFASAFAWWLTRAPATDGNTVALQDGSAAQLFDGARLEVVEQSARRVSVQQQSGRVRYQVTPNAGRVFSVQSGAVSVRVLGTIFTVVREPGWARVEVERGRVEVSRGGQPLAILGPGDSVRTQTTADDDGPAPSPGRPQEPATSPEPQAPLGERPVSTADDPAELAPAAKTTPNKTVGGVKTKDAAPSVDELLGRADAARAEGDLDAASRALKELVRRAPGDPRAVGAAFTLGRIERTSGRAASSAAAFDLSYRLAPAGPLAEDALREAAVSWETANRPTDARAAARRYLEHFPSGVHAAQMSRLAR